MHCVHGAAVGASHSPRPRQPMRRQLPDLGRGRDQDGACAAPRGRGSSLHARVPTTNHHHIAGGSGTSKAGCREGPAPRRAAGGGGGGSEGALPHEGWVGCVYVKECGDFVGRRAGAGKQPPGRAPAQVPTQSAGSLSSPCKVGRLLAPMCTACQNPEILRQSLRELAAAWGAGRPLGDIVTVGCNSN